MRRVFVETTVPSFYFETRTNVRSKDWRAQTRLWWDGCRSEYELITSPLVIAEFRRSPAVKAAGAEAFFSDVEVVDPPPEFQRVVQRYIADRLMPAQAAGDAAHLAVASLCKADFLLTWNCRHLANANKQQHIRVINQRIGLTPPIITTPFELIPE